MNGIELIAAERQRQIDGEGWTLEHDDKQAYGALAKAGVSYASLAVAQLGGRVRALALGACHIWRWPWSSEWWKPSNDPIRNLVKAGALIAAEIDRLQRITS